MGQIQNVVDALRQLETATSITITTGEFDIIVRLDLSSLELLYDLTVQKISKIKGLERITTAVVEKEF